MISRSVRWLLAILGMGLVSALATAWVLRPEAQGFGTHQQLGLPPCFVVALYGQRCPACGMTTSWSHLARGQISSAWRANAGGTLLGLFAFILVPWSLLSAWRGSWWLIRPHDVWILSALGLVATFTLGDWTWRLISN